MSVIFFNVEKRIQDTVVFPAFNLSINTGQIVAIYTNVNIRVQLIDLLLGKTSPSQGKIRIEDRKDSNQPSIGFLFLNHGLYERLTVEEMLSFIKGIYSSDYSISKAVKKMQLETIRKDKMKKISFSEQKRVQFACLLIQNPSVYVLEEPDQNLDLESKRIFQHVLNELRQSQKAVIIITGNLEHAITSADDVYKLDDNGLISIPVKTVASEETAEDTLNEPEEIKPVSFEKIPSKVNDKIVLFHPTEIDYIESNDGQTYLQVKGESFPCAFTLQQLETRLLPYGYFRCHRSYIVNLQKVREVITWTRNSYSLVLEDVHKSTIPLSKSKMAELKQLIGI